MHDSLVYLGLESIEVQRIEAQTYLANTLNPYPSELMICMNK